MPTRSFTPSAILTGLLGALLVVAGAWYNDQHLQLSSAIGCFLAPLPLGILLALVLAWNPLVSRWPKLRFSTGELTVVIALLMLVAWLPVSGFFRYFQVAVGSAQLQADLRPEWRRLDILGHLPGELFPLGGGAEDAAMAEAIAGEQSALADGRLAAELAAAGVPSQAYADALDLAALLPARSWRDADQASPLANARRALQRNSAQALPPGVAGLLAGMPGSLDASGAPPAWRLARQRLDAAFTARLPEANRRFETVYTGLAQGLPVADEAIPPSAVPWGEWLPALVYWLPLVLLLALAVLMLSVVVHRQWAQHEQLPYPIATVTGALLRRDEDGGGIYRQRLFWAGAAPVLGLHLLNGLALWFPGRFPVVTLHWQQADTVLALFPAAAGAGGINSLAFGDIYFGIIGLSYFIASEVSFSMGIVGLCAVLFNLHWYTATGTTSDLPMARCGAYLGFAAILLWTGRSYYLGVLRRACGGGGGCDGGWGEAVWAARLFLAASLAFAVLLSGALGLDWFIAIAYTAALMLLFLVFTRVVCETGIPFLQAGWQPAQLVANLLGISAVGPGALVLLHYLGSVLSQDPRECLMPFAANALKVADDAGVRRLRLALLGGVVIAVALVVGFLATTWGMYNFGTTRDRWAQQVVARNLGEASRGVSTLVETGLYGASAQASGLGRLALVGEAVGRGGELGWMAFGAAAVMALALLRFRWPGCYLHPVLFLVWDTYPAQRVWLSFAIGWLVKEAVVRFGGGRAYRALRPLFIGLVAGELTAVLASLGIGWAYHLMTGQMPRTMAIFAG